MTHRNPILIDPEIMDGTPCFEGTRVPVSTLFDCLGGGNTLDAFLHDFPTVTREQAIAALEVMRDAVDLHAKYVGPIAGYTAEQQAAFDRELREGIDDALAGRVITMEESLAALEDEDVPDRSPMISKKASINTQESEAERAHVLEQMKISLAQARAGHSLTAEESLADLERAETEMDAEQSSLKRRDVSGETD